MMYNHVDIKDQLHCVHFYYVKAGLKMHCICGRESSLCGVYMFKGKLSVWSARVREKHVAVVGMLPPY